MRHQALREAAAKSSEKLAGRNPAGDLALNKFFMTEFQSGDRLYIYPTDVMKNKALKGLEVDAPYGYAPSKPKKRSFKFIGPGFKEIAWKDIPPKVQKKFQGAGING